ncbi:MAG: purine-nucleoside phosphorylase [Clostridia bacterium]|jgi:purine-nucleoside phosphorylase
MNEIYKKACESSEYIKNIVGFQPEIAIVLGSGLNSLADGIENAIEIDYKSILNFPVTTVEGHDGKLIAGGFCGKKIIALKGRFHYYEGYDTVEATFYIRVLKLLGIKTIILTNAAGGINKDFSSGDLMIITDHISFFAPSPLRGANIPEFGLRFFDMSEAYDKELVKTAENAAKKINISIKKGVYAFAQGPMYETPAEIRALGIIGADAVGMSTVPEVIVSRHSGIKVLGISCITNMAAGIANKKLNHLEVLETAKNVEKNFTALLKEIVSGIV